jgi:hypothetical protein
MIDFLNTNQGFIMSLLTAVYVIATIIIVIVSIRSNIATKDSLEEFKKAEKRKYRPYVIFDITPKDYLFYTKLKNEGITPAIDIKINVKPNIYTISSNKKELCPITSKGLSYLAPQNTCKNLLAFGSTFFENYKDPIFEGTIEYFDVNEKKYNEKFRIDLSSYKELRYISEKDIGNELEKISKSLEKISSSSFKPLIRTIEEDVYQAKQKNYRIRNEEKQGEN